MQKRGLSARIVRHTHSALRNALKQAVKWGLLSRNPCDLVELPKVPHKEEPDYVGVEVEELPYDDAA
jgi:integrase